LGIFAPDTPVGYLEHILLNLDVNPHTLATGDPISGSNVDVLTAYEAITSSGGISIAAHVNTNNGVMMLDKNWGGQTRIAYTQDLNLHALEVTDLTKPGRRNTARFFDGSKPEYPRRMHCIQGSDAHRLRASTKGAKSLGVGDRITEVSLGEVSFNALKEVFNNRDFARTRPYTRSHDPYDPVQAAREEGPNIVQSFHPQLTRRGGHLFEVLADICAMANTNGGTIYIGASENPKEPVIGVSQIAEQIELLYGEVDNRMTPKLDIEIDTQESQGKPIIRILVPRGAEFPYAIDENKFYVRDETETSLAVRDEIVQLILRAAALQTPGLTLSTPVAEVTSVPLSEETPAHKEAQLMTAPPQTGVEIISSENRNGHFVHTVRDLRNGNTVNNVTRKSARHLWHYAITQHESQPVKAEDLEWHGDIALIKRHKRGNLVRYDLAQIGPDNQLRVYYGVTPDGMDGPWQHFIEDDE
jgi:hypothetical protein